jgi:serine/threonine-protein kinase
VVNSDLHQSVVNQASVRIGTTLLGQWHIDALLGMGGMAAVYAATSRDGQRVAIKMLHTALSVNEAIRKRFAREAYVANTIEHPCVVRVLHDGVAEDGSAFLVMDLLEGETASARAARLGGKLPVHEVAYVGEAVAGVLAAAHAARVIHRDIKPENVFITNQSRVVVLDFGIARVSNASGMTDSQTRTGTMMGTPAFMPPEQARGRANEMDATSDVWALGATLFWLASGRVVHEAETPNEQLVAAATLPAPSLGRIAPDVPGPLVAVIDRALEFAKENRFADAIAMKEALQNAVQAIAWNPGASPSLGMQHSTLPPTAGGPTIGPVEVGGRRRQTTRLVRAALVGAGIGTVVLVGLGVFLRSHKTAEEPAPAGASVPTPSVSVETPAPPVTAAATTAVVASVVTVVSAQASAHTTPHAVPKTPRANWLDRRR